MGVASLLLAAAIVVSAQQAQPGSIAGAVQDMAGTVFPEVVVTVKKDTDSRVTRADAQGRYRFDELPPGRYTLSMRSVAFVDMNYDSVVVRSGSAVNIPPTKLRAEPTAPDPVELYIAQLTGPNAVDCGHHIRIATDDELQKSLDCGLAASKRKEAFVTVKHQAEVTSRIARGLLGKPDGSIFLFSYDSAPCGG